MKDVILMAYPAVFESFFISLAAMVDFYMVSGLGFDVVAAVGLTSQPKMVGLAIFILSVFTILQESVSFMRPFTAYLFAYILGFGMNGIWIGILADQLSRCVLGFLRFRQGKWDKIKI